MTTKFNLSNSNYINKITKFNKQNTKSVNMMIHPDQKYIDALKNNENVLIQEIYEVWYPDVEKFVLKNSGTESQAKALFQDALTALWEKVKTAEIKLTAPFGAYFYPIYRFKWLNYLNRDKERKNINTGVEVQDVDKYKDAVTEYLNEETENIKERRLQVFKECFKNLSEDCQKMLNLKFEGKKAEEIRKITSRPSSNAVFVAMHGCRNRLKTLIEAHPEFETLHL